MRRIVVYYELWVFISFSCCWVYIICLGRGGVCDIKGWVCDCGGSCDGWF